MLPLVNANLDCEDEGLSPLLLLLRNGSCLDSLSCTLGSSQRGVVPAITEAVEAVEAIEAILDG